MSNKELCIRLINEIDDSHLADVANLLQCIKNILEESTDERYCQELHEDYLKDTTPDKHETISL